MAFALDETHDPKRSSWVASAQGHPEFPIQNLPRGIFSRGDARHRPGSDMGDSIFDVAAALEAGLFSGDAERAAAAVAGGTLNGLLALGAAARIALRKRVSSLLAADSSERAKAEAI